MQQRDKGTENIKRLLKGTEHRKRKLNVSPMQVLGENWD